MRKAASLMASRVLPVLLAGALCAGMFGCSSTGASEAASVGSGSQEALAESEGGATDSSVPVLDETAYDFSYSNRDVDASYDESSATKVALSGSSAIIDGAGAAIQNGVLTISEAGVYVLSGDLSGSVVVEAPEDAKVQIVLANASIQSPDGPAIYVKQADKCFLTLADSSSNQVEDSAVYTLAEGQDEPDSAIFSKCDLTIQGSGSLSVSGNYLNAVKSKDDLVVSGGDIDVSAVDSGLVGRDKVGIAAGSIRISSGGDGVKSTNDEDASKGFITVDGGSLQIEAQGKGIKATSILRVAGGSVSVVSTDDSLHSNGDVHVIGGDLSLSSGDDGVHADSVLQIDGGDLLVSESCEGLEGQAIYLSDGTVRVVSSDDGLNAASSNESDGASDRFDLSDLQGSEPQGDDRPQGDEQRDGEPAGAQGGEQPGGGQPGGGRGDMQVGGMDADSSCAIVISGSYLVVDAQGDGIDSNGSLEVAGGTVLVSGPSDSANGSLDYGTTASISGGTVIACGSSGMAASFTEGTQAFAMANVKGEAGSSIVLLDSNGNAVASFTAARSFDCVVVSSPLIGDGDSGLIVVGAAVANGNSDGYASSPSYSGGSAVSFTASLEGGASAVGGDPGRDGGANGGPQKDLR